MVPVTVRIDDVKNPDAACCSCNLPRAAFWRINNYCLFAACNKPAVSSHRPERKNFEEHSYMLAGKLISRFPHQYQCCHSKHPGYKKPWH